jgi:hypothetical protein
MAGYHALLVTNLLKLQILFIKNVVLTFAGFLEVRFTMSWIADVKDGVLPIISPLHIHTLYHTSLRTN